jgi:hypothetical protein
MNKITFFLEPGDNQIGYAAALILKLLTQGQPGDHRPSALEVSPEPGSDRLRIIAHYPDQAARLAKKNEPKRAISKWRRRRFIPVARKN